MVAEGGDHASVPMSLRRRLCRRISTALCVIIIGCIWLAVSGSGHDGKAHPSGAGHTSGMWRALARKGQMSRLREQGPLAVRRNFPVTRSAPERMPSKMEAHIRSSMGAPPRSFDLTGAQRVDTVDEDLWIVNGRNAGAGIVCLVQANGGAVACTTVSDFAAHGLALGIADPAKQPGGHPEVFHLLGVAPKWIGAVQVRIGGEETRRIPVPEGSYAVRATSPIFVKRFLKHGE